MAVQLILKNSSVEDKSPTSGQLANGELALNYNKAGAFLSCVDSDGNIQQVGGVKISAAAPSTPAKQALWFNPTTFGLFVFDGTNWLAAAGGGGGGGSVTVIGNDGISANTLGSVVTLDVELESGDNGLSLATGKLQTSIATASTIGSVKVGTGLTIEADGTLNSTGGSGDVESVNGKTGVVILNAADVGAATTAQGAKADTALQPGDVPAAPVESVNGKTGTVSLGIDDLSDVSVGTASSGDVLSYNGTVWVSSASPPADISGSSINQLNDVDAGSATNGQVMVWDTNAGNWVPGDAGGGAVDSVNNKTGVVVLDAADVGAATTAQGATADTALQPGQAATTTQGAKADTAVQPGDDISDLNNDAGYITASGVPAAPVESVNGITGVVILTPAIIGAATIGQGITADLALQPGDDISELNNNAGYVTAADVPVDSVNGETGVVSLGLDNLTDVDIDAVSSGEVLAYNGSIWVAAAAPPADISGSSINQLDDVNAGSATDGQMMTWDDTSGNWVAVDVPFMPLDLATLPELV